MPKQKRPLLSRTSGIGLLIFIIFFLPAIGLALNPKEVYQQVGDGVVFILGSDNSKTGSGGTGSIIHPKGFVITNAHVVISKKTKRPYKKINIFLKPEKVTGNMNKDLKKRYKAQVLGYDESLDLALLEIENPPRHLKVVALGNPEEVSIGELVVAIGHPETGGLWTLTTGAISSEMEDFRGIKGKHIFQTETSFNRGNSGGPLLDTRGYMVGVNTSISRRSGDGLAITDINFSIKSSVALDWLSSEGIPIHFASASPSPKPPVKEEISSQETSQEPIQKAEPKTKPPQIKGPKTSRAKTITKAHPYHLDRLIASQMKEMEDLMDEMRGIFRK